MYTAIDRRCPDCHKRTIELSSIARHLALGHILRCDSCKFPLEVNAPRALVSFVCILIGSLFFYIGLMQALILEKWIFGGIGILLLGACIALRACLGRLSVGGLRGVLANFNS